MLSKTKEEEKKEEEARQRREKKGLWPHFHVEGPARSIVHQASLTIAVFVVAGSALSTQSWWGSRPPTFTKG